MFINMTINLCNQTHFEVFFNLILFLLITILYKHYVGFNKYGILIFQWSVSTASPVSADIIVDH